MAEERRGEERENVRECLNNPQLRLQQHNNALATGQKPLIIEFFQFHGSDQTVVAGILSHPSDSADGFGPYATLDLLCVSLRTHDTKVGHYSLGYV